LLFYAAWSFKQTTVLLFVACCLIVLIAQRWMAGFVALIIPFGVLVVATFVAGGRNYYLNTIFAPSINAFVASTGIAEIAKAILASPFLWICGLVGFSELLSQKVSTGHGGSLRSPITQVLLLGYLLCVVGDGLGICRLGSARNTLLEAFLVSAILACIVLSDMPASGEASSRKTVRNAALLIAATANVLVLSGRLISLPGLGRLTVASSDDFASRLKLAKSMEDLPAPVLIREGILTLPWYANKNHYPAVMDDYLFYQAALQRGDLKEYPIQVLVASHHFRSLLVTEQDPALGWALEAGCRMNASQTFSEWSLTRIDCAGSKDATIAGKE